MEKQKSLLAAVYARVSGDRQKKEETIKSQLDAIDTYAKANNYHIMKEWIYKDEAETGKSLERPGLDELRFLVKEGGPDVIIVHEPDRLIRKSAYQVFLIEEFERQGVLVKFVKVKTPETPEEQLALNMMGVFAEYEREKIADRCRRGRIYKAKTGKISVFPQAPYGFIKENGSFEIDPEKSKIVKEMFFLYAHKNYSLRGIGKYLEERGVLAPRNGKRWDMSTVREILKNETYIGTAYFGKSQRYDGIAGRIVRIKGKKITKSKNARKERPKEMWIPIPLQGFIGEDDFQIVQDRLLENKKLSLRNTKKISLLQGLIVCKECGKPFYKKLRGKVCRYHCSSKVLKNATKCNSRSIIQDQLDSIVWDQVVHMLKDPTLLIQEVSRRVEENKEGLVKHLKREKVQKELAQLSKAKDKLLDAYEMGDCLTIEELQKRIEKINKKIKELDADLKKLDQLEAEIENSIDIKATLENLEKRLIGSSMELSIEEKQKVIRLLIDEIVIGKESIKIKHCIPCVGKLDQKSPLRGDRLKMFLRNI